MNLNQLIQTLIQWIQNPIYQQALAQGWAPNALANMRPGSQVYGAYGLKDPIQELMNSLSGMSGSLPNLVSLDFPLNLGYGLGTVDPRTGSQTQGVVVDRAGTTLTPTAYQDALARQQQVNAAQAAETQRQSQLAANLPTSFGGNPPSSYWNGTMGSGSNGDLLSQVLSNHLARRQAKTF